jgi:hypothetical protein
LPNRRSAFAASIRTGSARCRPDSAACGALDGSLGRLAVEPSGPHQRRTGTQVASHAQTANPATSSKGRLIFRRGGGIDAV